MFLQAILGDLIGALLGATLWTLIGYFAHREVSLIAWAIGGLVGLGVRVGSKEWDGVTPGLIAVSIASLTIIISKFLVVFIIVKSFTNEIHDVIKVEPTDMIARLADDIAADRIAKKKKITWPAGITLENAKNQNDYPKNIWKEAEKKWNDMPQDVRDKKIKNKEDEIHDKVGSIETEARGDVFRKKLFFF